jgi:hypothetical protein
MCSIKRFNSISWKVTYNFGRKLGSVQIFSIGRLMSALGQRTPSRGRREWINAIYGFGFNFGPACRVATQTRLQAWCCAPLAQQGAEKQRPNFQTLLVFGNWFRNLLD